MFDYAIGHYQTHPPNRRMLASWVFSILSHVAAVLILYQYPELLQHGLHIWVQRPARPASPAQDPRWRTLASINTRMEMPPIEEIRKNLYDWNRPKATEGTRQPIHINLPPSIAEDVLAPAPKPQPIPPPQVNPAVAPPGTAAAGTPVPAAADLPRPAPAEAKKPAAANPPDAAPKQIPKGINEPPATSANLTASSGSGNANQGGSQGPVKKDMKDPGQQIRAQGPIFFDDKGFNLDDYANLVRERVKENWFIPSNLRNYQGSATIVFYINKDGQVTGARIDVPSGNDSLNLSALSAVFGSNPFPPLPKGFPAERVGARLVFAYNERQ